MSFISTIKLFFYVILLASTTCMAGFKPLEDFGANPGDLTASYFQPQANSAPQAIVVLLHGCTQNAQKFAQHSGFLGLAKQYNFILLLPQQSNKNNIKTCFNWFSNEDNHKDQGESLSIKNMLLSLQQQFSLNRTYIAGFSAGGAMTSALLVHYPHLFNAGAVVSGIPYPCADGLIKAIACMRNGPKASLDDLILAVKKTHSAVKSAVKIWPELLVITGDEDKVVNPINSLYLAKQWQALHHLTTVKKMSLHKDVVATQWFNEQQTIKVELINIANLGHAFSVNPKVKNGGTSAPFIQNSPLSSAVAIIKFWGLISNNPINSNENNK